MSEEKAPYGDIQPGSGVSLGKCWAALRNDNVVGVISMRVPSDVDFDAYRTKATECLELLGQVKAGDMVERDGERYFVQRPTHANRSKKPRPVKEYLIYQPRNV
ncbi:hypothetical protein [Pseudoalteromonas luteoviolacea]|uniref:hypothetical protein n=1 Tax=Pseudoalteromonas luteoviolacea TaxID=43657 RepID=UPI001B3978C2|nr:hypothetical protein [Pseudoalteromonas luteoviolacea]MBQ4840135.1 hypothetical protein [Pseudoalteromonas luteoviolacea]